MVESEVNTFYCLVRINIFPEKFEGILLLAFGWNKTRKILVEFGEKIKERRKSNVNLYFQCFWRKLLMKSDKKIPWNLRVESLKLFLYKHGIFQNPLFNFTFLHFPSKNVRAGNIRFLTHQPLTLKSINLHFWSD